MPAAPEPFFDVFDIGIVIFLVYICRVKLLDFKNRYADRLLAGLAFSVAIFWDAFADPLIGHVSDNTRSRWGRRHPYILVGGLLMAFSFYLLWMATKVSSPPYSRVAKQFP